MAKSVCGQRPAVLTNRANAIIVFAMSSTEKLLAEIERFLKRSGIAASTFGQAVVGDRNLVFRLRSGKDVTLGTADHIRQYMRDWSASKKTERDSMMA